MSATGTIIGEMRRQGDRLVKVIHEPHLDENDVLVLNNVASSRSNRRAPDANPSQPVQPCVDGGPRDDAPPAVEIVRTPLDGIL